MWHIALRIRPLNYHLISKFVVVSLIGEALAAGLDGFALEEALNGHIATLVITIGKVDLMHDGVLLLERRIALAPRAAPAHRMWLLNRAVLKQGIQHLKGFLLVNIVEEGGV